jgi:hypothetical protein
VDVFLRDAHESLVAYVIIRISSGLFHTCRLGLCISDVTIRKGLFHAKKLPMLVTVE